MGAARNAGMEKATGEFMVFLDSDDWLKEDYLTKLSATIRDNDIVVSGFERYASDYSFQYANVTPCNDWTKFKYCSVAGKMYRTDFIKKNHLKYKKFKIGEDCYFNINAYSKTKKVVVAEYAGYCNYENLSSVTNVKEYNPNNSFIHVLKAIDEEIDVCELNPKDMAFFYIKALVLDIFLHKDYVLKEYLVHEFRENIKWYKIVLDKLNLKFKMRSRKGETFKVNLVVNVFILAYKLQLVGLLMAVVKKMKVNLI